MNAIFKALERLLQFRLAEAVGDVAAGALQDGAHRVGAAAEPAAGAVGVVKEVVAAAGGVLG